MIFVYDVLIRKKEKKNIIKMKYFEIHVELNVFVSLQLHSISVTYTPVYYLSYLYSFDHRPTLNDLYFEGDQGFQKF